MKIPRHETTVEAEMIWGLLRTLRVTAAALMIKSFTDTLMSSERKPSVSKLALIMKL